MGRAFLPTLPFMALYALAAAYFAWGTATIEPGASGAVFAWLSGAVFLATAWSVLSAAVYARALPAGLARSFGVAVWHQLLALTAVVMLFGIIAFLLGLFVVIAAGIMLAVAGYEPNEAGDPTQVTEALTTLLTSGGGLVVYLMLLAAMAFLAWLSVRLFLFGAATAAEGRVTIFRSWPWTGRRAFQIVWIALFTVVIPLVVVSWLGLTATDLLGLPSSYAEPSGDPMMDAAASGLEAVLTAPYILVSHGAAAALYQRLAPGAADQSEAFA